MVDAGRDGQLDVVSINKTGVRREEDKTVRSVRRETEGMGR